MKVCKECGKQYSKICEHSTMYCSDECRKTRRNRLQKAVRNVIKKNPDKYFKLIIDRIYKTYKSSAKRYGRVFELTKDDFRAIYQNKCYYCGDIIATIGIDRMDNDLGYTKSNTVPCCKKCNWMKGSHNAKDFIDNCNKITNYTMKQK